jgi:hypothetical protein
MSNGFVKKLVHKGAETGPLRNLTFAVKDMYEVCGHANACGNPTWLATHSAAATSHAPCVQSLLDAGMQLPALVRPALFGSHGVPCAHQLQERSSHVPWSHHSKEASIGVF